MRTIFIFSLLALFVASNTLVAQNLSGGIALGANASQVDGDLVSGYSKVGLSLGGFVTYEFNDRLALQPEILFEQLGSATQGVGLLLNTNHISVPILLQATIPVDLGGGAQNVQLQAGPVIGVLLSARDQNRDLTASLSRTDLRAVAGVGYRFTDRWSLLVRWGYSVLSFVPTNATLSQIIAPGRAGLFHHYFNLSLRLHLQ